MIALEVGPLRAAEFPAAVGVLARGMRDNPIHIAALGSDPDRRTRLLTRLFELLFATMDNTPLAGRPDGEVVGVVGMARSPACMPSATQMLRFAPLLPACVAQALLRGLRAGHGRGRGSTARRPFPPRSSRG